jgi:hypothetical protein
VDLVVDEILPMDIHLVVPYTDINSYNSTTGIWNISGGVETSADIDGLWRKYWK